MAGIFGVGGGIFFVPALFYTFHLIGYSEINAMHLAVGTSLAVSIPGTISSYLAHKKRDNIDRDLLRSFVPFLVLGIFGGAYLATMVEGKIILKIFGFFLLFAAFAMVYTNETKSVFKKVPENPWRGIFSFAVGAFSSLLGIGGGTVTVPLFAVCSVPMKKAVGMASALSLIVCLFGTLAHIASGYVETANLKYSLGYVNYIAVLVMGPLGFIGAKIGAYTANRMHANWLRRLFALFLVALSLRMLIDAFTFFG